MKLKDFFIFYLNLFTLLSWNNLIYARLIRKSSFGDSHTGHT